MILCDFSFFLLILPKQKYHFFLWKTVYQNYVWKRVEETFSGPGSYDNQYLPGIQTEKEIRLQEQVSYT